MRRVCPQTRLFFTLALVAVAAAWCVSAHAQVTVDGTPGSFSGTSTSSLSGSVGAANAGSNGVLLVGVSLTQASDYVSSVTWGSYTLTCLVAQSTGGTSSCGSNSDSHAYRVEIWGIALGSVTTTAATLTVTLHASAAAASAGYIFLTGANQSQVVANSATQHSTNGASSITQAFSSLQAGSLIVDTLTTSGSSTIGVSGSGQVKQWCYQNSGQNISGCGSTEPVSGSSGTMTWSLSGSPSFAYVALAVSPASAAHARKGQVIIGQLEPMKSNDAHRGVRN
jgi:hypothetical protein